eukprot:6190704-Pleurochrysis_carterae.AAC.2
MRSPHAPRPRRAAPPCARAPATPRSQQKRPRRWPAAGVSACPSRIRRRAARCQAAVRGARGRRAASRGRRRASRARTPRARPRGSARASARRRRSHSGAADAPSPRDRRRRPPTPSPRPAASARTGARGPPPQPPARRIRVARPMLRAGVRKERKRGDRGSRTRHAESLTGVARAAARWEGTH